MAENKKKRFQVFVIVGLVLGLLILAGGVSGASLVVNQTANCTTGDAYHSSITSAEAAAISGDTIIVCPGTYNENVDVNVAVDIQSYSQNPADTIVQAALTTDHVFYVTVNNVNISGLTVTGATGTNMAGIYLYNSDYSTIENVNATDNYFGIYLYNYAYYNTISNNTVSSNTQYGIYLRSWSYYNTISNNTVSSNTQYGIYLYYYAYYNTISNNTVSSNNNGIYLYNYARYNTISNNTVSSNTIYGIQLNSASNSNTISDNTFNSNGYGVYTTGSSNLIYHNNFLSSTTAHAYDSSNNAWSRSLLSKGGNYWSNWTSPDSDGDGIVDSLYAIPGGGNQDKYPFTTQSGWTSYTPPSTSLVVGTIDPGATFYVDGTLASPGQSFSYSPGDYVILTTTYNGTNYTDEIEVWHFIDVSVHVNSTTDNGGWWYLDTDMGYTPYDIFIFEGNGTGTYYFDMWTNPAAEAAKIIGLHLMAPNGIVQIKKLGSHSHPGTPTNLAEVFYGTVENDNYLHVSTHCGGSGSMGSSFNKIVGKTVEFDTECKKNYNIRVQEIIADTIYIDSTEVTIWSMNLTTWLDVKRKYHGKSWNDQLPENSSLNDDPMLWYKARNPTKWEFYPKTIISGNDGGGRSWNFKHKKDGDNNFWEMNLGGDFVWKNKKHRNDFFGHFLGPLTVMDEFYLYFTGIIINFFGDDTNNYKKAQRFDGDQDRGTGGTDFWNPLLTTSAPSGYGYTGGSIISPIHVFKLRSGYFFSDNVAYGGTASDFYIADNQDLLILSDTSDIDFDCLDGCDFYEGTNSHWVVENGLSYLGDTPEDSSIDITQSDVTWSGNAVSVTANNTYENSQMYAAYRKKTDYGRQFTRVNLTYNGSEWVTNQSITLGDGTYNLYVVAVQNDDVYGKVVEKQLTLPGFAGVTTIENGTSGNVINEEGNVVVTVTANASGNARGGIEGQYSADSGNFAVIDTLNNGVKYLNIYNTTSLENVSNITITLYASGYSNLAIYYWNSSGSNWVKLSTGTNMTSDGGPYVFLAGGGTDSAYVVVDHFSYYAMAGSKTPPPSAGGTPYIVTAQSNGEFIVTAPSPITAGGSVDLITSITNLRSIVEQYKIEFLDLPSSWSVSGPTKVTLNGGEKKELSYTLDIPSDVPPGTYYITAKMSGVNWYHVMEQIIKIEVIGAVAPPVTTALPVVTTAPPVTAPPVTTTPPTTTPAPTTTTPPTTTPALTTTTPPTTTPPSVTTVPPKTRAAPATTAPPKPEKKGICGPTAILLIAVISALGVNALEKRKIRI